jgi:hypothetical protein
MPVRAGLLTGVLAVLLMTVRGAPATTVPAVQDTPVLAVLLMTGLAARFLAGLEVLLTTVPAVLLMTVRGGRATQALGVPVIRDRGIPDFSVQVSVGELGVLVFGLQATLRVGSQMRLPLLFAAVISLQQRPRVL